MVFKKSSHGIGLDLTGLDLEKIGSLGLGLGLVTYAAFIHAGLTTRYRTESL